MANTKILYLETDKRNLVDKFLLQNPGYWMRGEDGKIDHKRRMHPNPPWLYVKPRLTQKCHYWHKVLFNVLLKQRVVPTGCLTCWKTVIMPRNLEELMAVYLMQLHLNISCKCGSEGDRENTDRLWGGYFYSESQKDGQEVYELVKKTMEGQQVWEGQLFGCPIKAKFYQKGDIMKFVAGDVKIEGLPGLILKRGCTEYEQNVGPSDKWEDQVDEDQLETENIGEGNFLSDFPNFRQSEHQRANIINKFIHNAFRWGDLSYTMFTNGNRLFNPPVTYHKKPGGKKNGIKKRT
jgi:hypothetical protein